MAFLASHAGSRKNNYCLKVCVWCKDMDLLEICNSPPPRIYCLLGALENGFSNYSFMGLFDRLFSTSCINACKVGERNADWCMILRNDCAINGAHTSHFDPERGINSKESQAWSLADCDQADVVNRFVVNLALIRDVLLSPELTGQNIYWITNTICATEMNLKPAADMTIHQECCC